jgi:hypothetical protein
LVDYRLLFVCLLFCLPQLNQGLLPVFCFGVRLVGTF